MPSGWTLLWFGWGLYFLVVEGMALANSTEGDTLSEHVWAFLGLNHPRDKRITSKPTSFYGQTIGVPTLVPIRRTTAWTWVRRAAVAGFMASLGIHFLVGSHPLWNAILITASIVLGATVVTWWVLSRGARNPWKA